MSPSERGQALTEFALTAIVLMLAVLGVIELGRAYYSYNALTYAVQEGARFAITHSGASLVADTQALVIAKADAMGVHLTTAPTVTCSPCQSGDPVSVGAAYDFASALPVLGVIPLRASATAYME